MGNGNIDVGNGTPSSTPGQPLFEDVAGEGSTCELRIKLSVNTAGRPQSPVTAVSCGAMSQQAGEFGDNISAPQGFLHLVGCRERKVEPGREKSRSSQSLKQ